MDGIARPPLVLDVGLSRGILHLIVLECPPGMRAYGVEIDCQIYAAFEEMIYSVADHCGPDGSYGGGIYIKEARNSQLLASYAKTDPLERSMRHFLFVGGDYCFETLGPTEPIIRTFANSDQAYAWAPLDA